jgi:hypothetical protein
VSYPSHGLDVSDSLPDGTILFVGGSPLVLVAWVEREPSLLTGAPVALRRG